MLEEAGWDAWYNASAVTICTRTSICRNYRSISICMGASWPPICDRYEDNSPTLGKPLTKEGNTMLIKPKSNVKLIINPQEVYEIRDPKERELRYYAKEN